jgi:outer membrane immunogenic protein
MIRKFLLASVGALALTGSAALAADLPSRAPPPVYVPPAPIFTWTGIYVGGQVGYAWGSGSGNFTGFDPFTDVAFTTNAGGGNPNGVIGGGNVGYNYEIPGWNWFSSSGAVIGLEGSVDGSSLSKTAVATVPIFGGFSTVDVHSKLDVQGSIRGRLGFAWDRVLIYATGGVAFGGINTDITVFGTDFFGTPVFGSGNRSTTRVGWTVGGGLQYALTNNWSVRAEYRFTDFGRINQTGVFEDTNPLILTPTAAFIGNRRIQENQVQVGFDYKFDLGAPAPVVAKY